MATVLLAVSQVLVENGVTTTQSNTALKHSVPEVRRRLARSSDEQITENASDDHQSGGDAQRPRPPLTNISPMWLVTNIEAAATLTYHACAAWVTSPSSSPKCSILQRNTNMTNVALPTKPSGSPQALSVGSRNSSKTRLACPHAGPNVVPIDDTTLSDRSDVKEASWCAPTRT